MKDNVVLDGIMMDLTFLGPSVSSNLLANIAPSIYWLFDHPIDGSTSIYWMASSRWMVATTDHSGFGYEVLAVGRDGRDVYALRVNFKSIIILLSPNAKVPQESPSHPNSIPNSIPNSSSN